MCGFTRAHALRQIALDILDHHDRVIDCDAHREHQTKQGQVVNREAEGLHHRKGPDERDRNRDDWNDGRAPGLQEQQDHQHHQQHRLKNTEIDFVHGFFDELGGIERDLGRHTGWHIRFD